MKYPALSLNYVNSPIVADEADNMAGSDILVRDILTYRLYDSSGDYSIEANVSLLVKRAVSVVTTRCIS